MDEIDIIQLPVERWAEYKQLRLEALQKDPQAFGQKYEKVLYFPDSYWIDHLKNTINKNNLLVYFAEHDGTLKGMMGAFFPINETEKGGAPIFSVYVNKDFREQGIAKKLQDRLLSELRKIKDLKKVMDGEEYEVDTLEQDLH